MIASIGELAMFFAISNFTTVNRAALFAARVAAGAVVGSSDGGIWGVSDPLCHPPITVPRPVFGGRSRPPDACPCRAADRALFVPSSSAPPCIEGGVYGSRAD